MNSPSLSNSALTSESLTFYLTWLSQCIATSTSTCSGSLTWSSSAGSQGLASHATTRLNAAAEAFCKTFSAALQWWTSRQDWAFDTAPNTGSTQQTLLWASLGHFSSLWLIFQVLLWHFLFINTALPGLVELAVFLWLKTCSNRTVRIYQQST